MKIKLFFRSKVVQVFLVLALLLLYLASSSQVEKIEKQSAVTTFSQGPLGLSIFSELAEPNQIKLQKRSLLSLEDFKGVSLFILTGPKRKVSDLEQDLLSKFIKAGGSAYFSFHTREQYAHLRDLFYTLKIKISPEDIENFENKKIKKVSNNQQLLLAQAAPDLAVYSKLALKEDCSVKSNCYFKSKKFGKGKIIVQVGIPLIANGLIGQASNSKLADQFLDYGSILVDEYRHFFSNRDIYDLLGTPQFLFPLIAFIIILGLYFLFGYRRPSDSNRVNALAVLGPHQFSRELLAGLSVRKDFFEVNKYLAETLEKWYPETQTEIKKIRNETDLLGKITTNKIIKLHIEQLRKKGELK